MNCKFLLGVLLWVSIYLISCTTQSPIGQFNVLASNEGLHPVLDELFLTGTFGEYRRAHYHYGIDLGAKIGTPVYAAKSGYLKKFIYERYGYGYGLVIQHTDGTRTLYAHLDGLDSSLLEHPYFAGLKQKIYHRKEFRIHIPKNLISIQKGQLIARSGDTGNGPRHLHFEIMNDYGYKNPLKAGLSVPDQNNLHLEFLSLIPLEPNSRVNGSHQELQIPITKKPVKNQAQSMEYDIGSIAQISGSIAVKLSAYDPEANSRLGLTSGKMTSDKKKYFEFDFNEMPRLPLYSHLVFYDHNYSRIFGGTRYLHNFYQTTSHALPFAESYHNGVIHSDDISEIKKFDIELADASSKTSKVSFKLIRDTKSYQKAPPKKVNVFTNQTTLLKSADNNFELGVQYDSLLENAYMQIDTPTSLQKLPAGIVPCSRAYHFVSSTDSFVAPLLGKFTTPKISGCELYALRTSQIYPIQKAEYKNGAYHFHNRMSATFILLKDKIAPVIRIPKRKTLRRDKTTLKIPRPGFHILDIGSGVDYEKLQVWVDQIPVVTEHNGDTNQIEFFAPEHIFAKGRHKVIIKASDKIGNHTKKTQYDYYVH